MGTKKSLDVKEITEHDWQVDRGFYNEAASTSESFQVIQAKPHSIVKMAYLNIWFGLTDTPANDETLRWYVYYGDIDNAPDEGTIRAIAEWAAFQHWVLGDVGSGAGYLTNTVDHDVITPWANEKDNSDVLSQRTRFGYNVYTVSTATSAQLIMGTMKVTMQLFQRRFGNADGDQDIDDDVFVG